MSSYSNYQSERLGPRVPDLLLHHSFRYLDLRVCKDQLTPASSTALP